MDFFEAQARAKKRTSRLLVLFGLAVAGTIIALYVATIIATGASHRTGAPLPWWDVRILGLVSAATLVVVGGAALYKWQQYSAGGAAVAENVHGRRVEPHTTDLGERRLLNVVEEMAIASGVPVPSVYVLDDESGINAFAAGLTTSDAVVAVTRGTLEKLNRDELQGVIGHEFSHILNGDMRLNVRIAAIVFGILALGLIGRGILWSLRNTRTRGKGGGAIVAIMMVGLVLMIVGYAGYFFGRLIQAAVSRQREFLADASAVQFTRNPIGLVGALKKIGGFALGSRVTANSGGEINHFLFAQGFQSGFTGIWDTHPPLDERIRAIDPAFDGQYFEPPTRVDVTHESFASAGLAGHAPSAISPPPRSDAETPGAPASQSAETWNAPPPLPLAEVAVRAVASVGMLTSAQIQQAQALLEQTPPRLRDAARNPAEAPALVFALLLANDPAVRRRQREIVTQRAPTLLHVLDDLASAGDSMRDEQRLPLLQLALPALRAIDRGSLDAFLGTLDELVHADAQVSTFEFALQKLLTRSLELGAAPAAATVQIYSFNAVIEEIATVLSALAHAATTDANAARQAFAAGAAQIKLIESQLQFRGAAAADFATLDAALDKLARASGPIKHRTLVAAAQVVTADGRLLVCEAELLRAISAALDVPMPPLQVSAPQPA